MQIRRSRTSEMVASIVSSILCLVACAQTPTSEAESGPGMPLGTTALSTKLVATAANKTLTVAHRGDSGSAPENTMPAFEAAVRKGAEIVELDFHQTKDRILVCLHDSTLNRTTDVAKNGSEIKASVADYTLAELQALDAGSWKDANFAGTRIPTLAAALTKIQEGAITMIEHKGGDPEILVELLRRMKLVDDVIVQSFDWRFLEAVLRLEPKLSLAALGGRKSMPHPVGTALEAIERTRPFMVHWSFKRIRPNDVAALHRRGYLVCVYTIDDPTDYDRAIEMGIDAITTNEPARLLAHLRDRR